MNLRCSLGVTAICIFPKVAIAISTVIFPVHLFLYIYISTYMFVFPRTTYVAIAIRFSITIPKVKIGYTAYVSQL